MESKKEIEIEREILQYCQKAGIFAFKVRSTGSRKGNAWICPPKYHRKGVADVVGSHSMTPFLCEIKTDIGKLSPDQKLFMEDGAKSGFFAFVARSLEDFIEAMAFISSKRG